MALQELSLDEPLDPIPAATSIPATGKLVEISLDEPLDGKKSFLESAFTFTVGDVADAVDNFFTKKSDVRQQERQKAAERQAALRAQEQAIKAPPPDPSLLKMPGSVLNGTKAPPLDTGAVETQGVPYTREFLGRVQRQMDAASPEKRAEMVARTDTVGRAAKEVMRQYEAMDKAAVPMEQNVGGTPTVRMFDTRREAISGRLARQGIDTGYYNTLAKNLAATGRDDQFGAIQETQADFEEPNVGQRVWRDWESGVVGSTGATLAYTGRKMGVNALADIGDSMDKWAQGKMPANPTTADKIVSAFGSSGSFLVPGLGVTKGVNALSVLSLALAKWLGAGTMAGLEAAAEADGVYKTLVQQGIPEHQAMEKADGVFWKNMPLLGVTDKIAFFNDVKAAKKAADRFAQQFVRAALVEGVQETGQQFISNDATGRPIGEGALEAGLIGALVGGVSGGVRGISEVPPTPGDRLAARLYSRIEGSQIDQNAVDAYVRQSMSPDMAQQTATIPAPPIPPMARAVPQQPDTSEWDAFLAGEQSDQAFRLRELQQQQQKQRELDAMQAESRDVLGRNPDQRVAAAQAATDQEPTAMELAMRRAGVIPGTVEDLSAVLSDPRPLSEIRAEQAAQTQQADQEHAQQAQGNRKAISDTAKRLAALKGMRRNGTGNPQEVAPGLPAGNQERGAVVPGSGSDAGGGVDGQGPGLPANPGEPVSGGGTDVSVGNRDTAVAAIAPPVVEQPKQEPKRVPETPQAVESQPQEAQAAPRVTPNGSPALPRPAQARQKPAAAPVKSAEQPKQEPSHGQGQETPEVLNPPEGEEQSPSALHDAIKELIFRKAYATSRNSVDEIVARAKGVLDGSTASVGGALSYMRRKLREMESADRKKQDKETAKVLRRLIALVEDHRDDFRAKASPKIPAIDKTPSTPVAESQAPAPSEPGDGGVAPTRESGDQTKNGFTLKGVGDSEVAPTREMRGPDAQESTAPQNQEVPKAVRDRVAGAIETLRDFAKSIENAKTLEDRIGQRGRYQADTWTNGEAQLDAARKTIDTFRALAKEKGIDADAYLETLGGVPDLAPSKDAQEWLDAPGKGAVVAGEAPTPERVEAGKSLTKEQRKAALKAFKERDPEAYAQAENREEPPKPIEDSIGWESMSREDRATLAMRAGWRTNAGTINQTGRQIVSRPWAEQPEKTKETLIQAAGNKPAGSAMLSRASDSEGRQAPVFYSQLARVVQGAKLGTVPARQWKAWLLSNGPKLGVKKEEIDWSGITDWLDAQQGKVSKEDVAAFLEQGGVKVETVVLGESTPNQRAYAAVEKYAKDRNLYLDGRGAEKYSYLIDEENDNETVAEGFATDMADSLGLDYDEGPNDAKYADGDLVLPGGTDHREIVLIVPSAAPYNEADATHYGDVGKGKQIAWARVNTRADADGRKVLFIEEIQSQRNQHGRTKGFVQPVTGEPITDADRQAAKEYFDVKEEYWAHLDDVGKDYYVMDMRQRKSAGNRAVPTAPFVSTKDGKPVDSYISLVLKRLIAYAVETGHDSIAWTTGEQQADRYDLSKRVSGIAWQKDTGELYTRDVGVDDWNDVTLMQSDVTESSLADYVGKDMAERMKASSPDENGYVMLEGDDLKVGGAWTASMYGDANGLNAQGKPSMIAQAARKLGAEVGAVTISVADPISDPITGEELAHATYQQPGFVIPVALREKVLGEGLPLFSRAGDAATFALEPYGKDFIGAEVQVIVGAEITTSSIPNLREVAFYDAEGTLSGKGAMVFLNGRPSMLVHIVMDNQLVGGGETVVRALVASAGENGLYIYDMLPKSVGFWQKMGTIPDNLGGWEHGHGTIFWEDYQQSRASQVDAARTAQDQGVGGEDESAGQGFLGRRETSADRASNSGRIPGRIHAEDLSAVKAEFQAIFPGLPIREVENENQLPKSLRQSIRELGAQGDTAAAFHEGAVWLVQSGIHSITHARRVIPHEATHAGLDWLLGAAKDRLLLDIHKSNTSVSAAAKGIETRYGYSTVRATEEVLADMGPKVQKLKGWTKLLTWVRRQFRRLGWVQEWTDADVTDLVLRALAQAKRGPKVPMEVSRGTAFARGEAGSEAMLSRTSDAINLASEVLDTITQPSAKSFGLLKGLQTQLHKARTVPEYGRVFRLAMAFRNDLSRTAFRPWEYAKDILPAYDNIRGALTAIWKGKKGSKDIAAAGKFLFDGTMYGGGNPLSGLLYSDAKLKSLGATDETIRLYHQARDAIDASLDEIAAAVAWKLAKPFLHPAAKYVAINDPTTARDEFLDLLEIAREAAENQVGYPDQKTAEAAEKEIAATIKAVKGVFAHSEALKAAGYAPLMRFGKYTVSVRGVTPSGQDNLLEFSTYETETEAKFAEREAVKKFGQTATVTRGILPESPAMFQGVDPETVALFAKHVGKIPGLDIDKAVLDEYYRTAVSQRSALTRTIKRKGVAGYSEDLPRVLASFLTSNARYASSTWHMGDMREAIQDIYDQHGKGDLYDEAQDLYDYINGTKEPGAWMRGLMFAWYLGGTPSAAMNNLTQPIMTTWPFLSQWKGATKAMASSVGQAMGLQPIPAGIRGALRRAQEEGVVEAQEIHHLYQEGMRPILSRLPGGDDLRARAQGAATLWGAFFGLAENFNRRITFLAAYKMASQNQDLIKKFGSAYEFARLAVEETQGVYAKENRPNFARGIGPLGVVGVAAFIFKQYSIGYVELLARMWRSGPEGKRAAGLMLGILALASGLQGLPFAEDIEDLIDTLLQSFGYKGNSRKAMRDKLAAEAGERIADIVLYGASAETPIDVQARLGLGNMLPATGIAKPSEQNKAAQVAEMFGPPGGMARSVGDSVDALQSGGTGDAFKAFSPKMVQDVRKAWQMWETGQYRDTKGRNVAPVSKSDAAIKAIGYQPTSVAEPSRKARMVQQDIGLARKTEAEIVGAWVRASIDKDEAGVQRAKDRLADWNLKNPETKIRVDADQIVELTKQMKAERKGRLIKSAPKELRGYASESLK